MIQIDSGSSGVVYGVNDRYEIYCRAGITKQSIFGNSWVLVPGFAKHVSCGDYACLIVRPDNTSAFLMNVSIGNCEGSKWLEMWGKYCKACRIVAKAVIGG